MKSEIHLFIIWSNAKKQFDLIVNNIKKNFELLNIYLIEWDKNQFSENLRRFYGENLPKNSEKEKLCGNNPFYLIVVKDLCPLYRPRKTSKGIKTVNVNMFDSKELYRYWTGGGHLIHGSNNLKEAIHDLSFLLGMEFQSYIDDKYTKCENIIQLKKNISGLNYWESLEEVFFILNLNINYVVLRNFYNLPLNADFGPHSDIDLLVDDYLYAKYLLNSTQTTKIPFRVQNKVIIKNDYINFDLRNIGDNYYDTKWETRILETKEKYKCFYIPNTENLFYSLIYHAIIHKPFISKDYITILNTLSTDLSINFNEANMYDLLISYLDLNNYEFVEPRDCTVYFNKVYTNKNMSLKKFLLKILNKIQR